MPQYELNLRDYFRIFRKRRLTIVITFILVTVLSVFYLSKHEEVYKATATIKIEERKTIAGLLTEWIVYNPADVLESESKFITSFPVITNVGVALNKVPRDWFEHPNNIDSNQIKPEHVEELNRVVSELQGVIETERVVNTNMIKIVATSGNPKEAMELANSVAQVYLASNLKEKNRQATQEREFIEEQLKTIESKLRSMEESLRQYGQGADQIKISEPIEQKLLELQFKLAELLQKYTQKHPQVIQLKDQIKSMEVQVHGVSGQQLEYSRLTREVEVNKKLYSTLKEKLEEARISEAQKVSAVSIVNPAVLPTSPISGDNSLKILMGAFLGLILGVALAFIFETLDTSIGTIEDVENVIKLPVLGVVPPIEYEVNAQRGFVERIQARFNPKEKTDAEERFVHLFSHYQPQSPTTEAYRNIHTNLKLSPARKTILITSSGPREGKSSVACNLALVMAQIGLKTVLVSADLRRPILAKVFGIKREPGLNELIMGTVGLDSALNNITDILLGEIGLEEIRKTPGIENIWILPTGHLPPNPVEILESKVLVEIIEKLKSRFDVVILDAPPVLPVTDSSLLAPKVDCVVLVYEIGRTSREGLMRAKVQLESAGAKIAGVVLNHTQTQTEGISPYPYYHKYKYYGKELEKKASSQKGAEKKEKV
ncbi:MAG: polysaccharide biosynthesis tyrosine autokinase [Candidatus Omnitrophica bacterium]|nr:polysaccharide biosynthesis tyrosine autokinase [Candidatus Omnitrophota bacterium]